MLKEVGLEKTARILSIDGGGIRGIIPATVIHRIEERTGKKVGELFHMVAGTSTGGILACALSAPDKSGSSRTAREVADLYKKRGMEIFSSSFLHDFGSLGGMVEEKYEAKNLEGILQEYFADTFLSAVEGDLLVTSYNIETRTPFFFKSWKARGERLRKGETAEGSDFLIRDVARATSAAPTYFEPAYVKNALGTYFPLIDGGVFASNPAMCALSSARVLYPHSSRYLVVSLGTGEARKEISYEEARDWGLVGWVRPLLYIILDGQSDVVDYQLRQQLNTEDYFRFETELRAESGDGIAPNDDMDDASPENIEKLEQVAEELIEMKKDLLDNLISKLEEPLVERREIV